MIKLYVLPRYRVYFDDKIATKYKAIVYSHECLSGDPAAYYRFVAKDDTLETCIQYFFYWGYQSCMMNNMLAFYISVKLEHARDAKTFSFTIS